MAELSAWLAHGTAGHVVDTNLVGTINCLEVARRHQAELVFPSTSRVSLEVLNALPYEENVDWSGRCTGVVQASSQGVAEDFPPGGTRTLYGATKLCAELLINEYVALYNLRTVVNRCGVLARSLADGQGRSGVAVLWGARHHFSGPLSHHRF